MLMPFSQTKIANIRSEFLNSTDSPIDPVYAEIFSQRQRECIYCSAQGLSSQETGYILNISKRTVESILNNCMLKLGCRNRYELIYLSTKYGFIRDETISPTIKNLIEKERLRHLL
ncbi:MAG: helix-turn-helix transcriptional regulator [Tatlockia sp.]|nr:helix-turn-helix transcriptional regulator [Tatlockia sp.]